MNLAKEIKERYLDPKPKEPPIHAEIRTFNPADATRLDELKARRQELLNCRGGVAGQLAEAESNLAKTLALSAGDPLTLAESTTGEIEKLRRLEEGLSAGIKYLNSVIESLARHNPGLRR